jgi:hypothetical protein
VISLSQEQISRFYNQPWGQAILDQNPFGFFACVNKDLNAIYRTSPRWKSLLLEDFAYYEQESTCTIEQERIKCIVLNFMVNCSEDPEHLDSVLHNKSMTIPEKIPDAIMTSTESDRFYSFYLNTRIQLLSLPQVNKFSSKENPPLIDFQQLPFSLDCYKPTIPVFRLSFIDEFKKEELTTLYRLLGIFKKFIPSADQDERLRMNSLIID